MYLNSIIVTIPDSIDMKPPYEITPSILKLITSISEKRGDAKANYLTKPSPQLRKQNKIKTIQRNTRYQLNK